MEDQHNVASSISTSVSSKLSDDDLAVLLLSGHKRKKVSFQTKAAAVALWVVSLILYSNLEPSDSMAEIFSLATLGLATILFGERLSNYKGPVWPAAGRVGQRIDKPTPLIIILFFGWFLLVATFLYFCNVVFNSP